MGDVFLMLIGYALGLISAVIAYNNRIDEWAEEAQKTKELLKECRGFYQKMYSLNIINSCSLPLYDDLKKRINQVLGDNTDEKI